MSEPISPWEYSVELSSPNGKYVARFNGNEIAMGGPSTGTLKLSNGFEMRANAAMIWSSDSKYLAVAVWTKINHQELAVVDVEKKQIVKIIPGFSVIEFHSFRRTKNKSRSKSKQNGDSDVKSGLNRHQTQGQCRGKNIFRWFISLIPK